MRLLSGEHFSREKKKDQKVNNVLPTVLLNTDSTKTMPVCNVVAR